jgi:hypothetical protein
VCVGACDRLYTIPLAVAHVSCRERMQSNRAVNKRGVSSKAVWAAELTVPCNTGLTEEGLGVGSRLYYRWHTEFCSMRTRGVCGTNRCST